LTAARMPLTLMVLTITELDPNRLFARNRTVSIAVPPVSP